MCVYVHMCFYSFAPEQHATTYFFFHDINFVSLIIIAKQSSFVISFMMLGHFNYLCLVCLRFIIQKHRHKHFDVVKTCTSWYDVQCMEINMIAL
jgi:hypothetical protein